MLSHRVLVASCLVVIALTANPVWAQTPKPKDGPLGMKFVPLPNATFYMGWDGTKGSAKKTDIKEDFEIAIHTVTQGQWQEVMGNNPSWFSRDGKGKDQVKDIKDEDLKHFPVEMVTWNNAQEFIKKLNEKEKGKSYEYRLPSEVEWEYACRGGATSEEECSYHFYFAKPTNDLSLKEANFADGRDYLDRTTKVGSYAPNKVGLYDMHGNVWQWCEDLLKTDALFPDVRVYRGGGWSLNAGYCRAAGRYGDRPVFQFYNLGFRLARVPARPAAATSVPVDSLETGRFWERVGWLVAGVLVVAVVVTLVLKKWTAPAADEPVRRA
jgi:formylglycine-generating enzyme required for sulfatase activity